MGSLRKNSLTGVEIFKLTISLTCEAQANPKQTPSVSYSLHLLCCPYTHWHLKRPCIRASIYIRATQSAVFAVAATQAIQLYNVQHVRIDICLSCLKASLPVIVLLVSNSSRCGAKKIVTECLNLVTSFLRIVPLLNCFNEC